LACLLGSGAVMAAEGDTFLPAPVRPVNTVPTTGPSAGDQNPYGVAFVPPGFPSGGPLNPGDILVSNFNAASNLQGSGTTIMDVPAIPPSPQATPVSIFFQGTAPLGLTTALNILREGFVLVGNFPSPDGTCGSASAGSILVIDKTGALSSTISGSAIQGPWDSALFDQGGKAKFFVANGLSGTVVRLDLAVDSVKGVTVVKTTQIASGYTHACDPVTFVDAPTGLVYDPRIDVLYVASSADNAVYAVSDAGDRTHDGGIGKLVYTDAKHLHGPLGMAMAPNGHLLVTNNDSINSDPTQPSEIVEFTVGGKFVKEISVDPTHGGSFGIAVQTTGDTSKLAAVDDVTSLFLIWTLNF
jgi:DNA-binding beta-propeller fold protein YncE